MSRCKRTRCSGGIAVQHRMAPARGIWLVPNAYKQVIRLDG